MAKLKAPFALDRSLNTTEQTSRNIADVLAEELSAIITALGGLNFINYEVVEELPTTGISTTTIYLVPSDDPQSGNTYDEYINLNGTSAGWEKIGSTAIDLSGYYTSAETDALLDEKVDKDSFDEQTATDEFTTINGGLLSECKVALSPNQDLHGYPEPWVGGASKNKLPLVLADIKSANTSGAWSGNVYTINNGTITVNTDDDGNIISIVGNGTFTAQSNLQLCGSANLTNGTSYDLNGCPSGGSNSTFRLSIYNNAMSAKSDTGSGVNFTYDSSGSNEQAYIRFYANYTANNVTFYPMIRLATESDPTFEPYENICPITGHTEVKVGDDGKNLIGLGTRLDGYAGMEFFEITSGAVGYYFKTSDLPDVVTINDVGGNRAYISYYNEVPAYGVVYLSKDQSQQTVPKTFTVDKTAEYVHIQLSYGTTDVTNIQIEEGSTATPYVPYNGYRVTVNLGGTYYSGTLDVVSGIFTPDTASVEYDGSNDENWGLSTFYTNTVIILRPADCAGNDDAISEQYKGLSNASDLITEEGFFIGSNINVHDNQNAIDVATWKAYLANHPLKICYKLATPQSIQLSPTPVKANVGENHLSAPLEGQEITEVKYKKMFTFDDVIAYIQSLS